MITVLYDHSTYVCSYAAKSDTEVVLYDENRNVIEHIQNVKGNEWNYISIFGGEWEDLPEEAKEYVLFIEKEIECPIKYVSVGAERESIIVR